MRQIRVSRAGRIALKELVQTRRDRLAALFTIVLPIVFTIFLGLIIGSASGDSHIPIAVVDQDASAASQQFLSRLQASPLLKLQTMTSGEIDTAVEDQKVAAALVIPRGFGTVASGQQATARAGGTATLTLIRLATSTGAQSVSEAVQAAVAQLNAELLATKVSAEQVAAALPASASAAGGQTGGATPSEIDLAAAARPLVQTALASPAVSVDTVDANAGSGAAIEGASGFTIASTGSLVQWVLFSLMTVATGVAWERRRGLLRRLAASGVSGREIIQGKVMGMVIITFLQQLMLILLGALAFGVGYFDSPAALLMTMISLSVLAAGVGLLISALFRSEPPVIATTVISAQLLAVLGGAWFPLEVTSATFSRVAHFFPTAYIMDSLHGIVLKGWGAGDVLGHLGIVWIWIVALFALAVWRFRPE